MKFRIYAWLDRRVAHNWRFVPSWLRTLICNRYDAYIMRTCVGDGAERGEIIR